MKSPPPSPIRLEHPEHWIACHDCDLLYRKPSLAPGERVTCHRCGSHLYAARRNGVERAFALGVTTFVLFVLANIYSFIRVDIGADSQNINVFNCIMELFRFNRPWLAGTVFGLILLAPAVTVAGLLYIVFPLRYGRRLPGAFTVLRVFHGLRPWCMAEVFFLGVLVSLVKVVTLAEISLGIGFWAFLGMILCLTAALNAIDNRELWDQLEGARSHE